MRVWSVFRKTVLEQVREWASLLMVIILCPFFVFLYWAMTGGGSTSYKILIMNLDQARPPLVKVYGSEVVSALSGLKYANGRPMVITELEHDRALANEKLKNRQAAALLIIPSDFTEKLNSLRADGRTTPTAVTVVGDAANPAYTFASILALSAADQIVQTITGIKPPVGWNEEFVTRAKPRTEFEMYVPGLLVLAILMVLFTTALPLVREREDRTLRRLRLSCMRPFDLLTGVSLAQVVIGTISVILTFLTAQALGFHSEGSLWAAVFVGIVTVGSVVAMGLLTACFCKNATAVLTIGTFPFFILMWFTGAAMPLPRVELFSIGSRIFAINDILPPTHAVIAMNKILSFGATLQEVLPDVGIMVLLTVFYYFGAVVIFQKTQMRTM
jgi:ABC-2 type transport system permease protein